MNEHTFTNNLYAHIFRNCKMQIAKCILSTTPKKKPSSPIKFAHEANGIKEQKWQGGMMFFSETSANNSYKACFSQPTTPLSTLEKLIIIQ